MTQRVSFLRRLSPQSLGGQLLVMLMLALAVTQGLGAWLLSDERNRAVRAALGSEAAGRAANIALLLDDAPAALRPSILRAAGSPLVRFDVGPAPEASQDTVGAGGVLRQVRQILGEPARDVRVNIHALSGAPMAIGMNMGMGGVMQLPDRMQIMHDTMMGGRREAVELTLSIRLAAGDWLNVRTMFYQPGLQVSPKAVLPLLLMALAVVLVAWWTARRIVGPMRALALGADRLGRGLEAAPLPLTGPGELRAATQAFNRMQERLTRLVAERTQMLAALSHDLRSPLTAMRLRVEMLDESEDSLRLKALIGEMQAMVEATLAFARGVAHAEPATTVDLVALLGDLVGDVGNDRAVLAPSPPVSAMVRPQSLKRALRNLIDNAVCYGGSATLSLTKDAGAAVIIIADHGPGLPQDQLEAVFEPFVRHEPSRSRETGGAGLGLSIARSIIQAHGGTVTLRNLAEGGLEAAVRLPVGAA